MLLNRSTGLANLSAMPTDRRQFERSEHPVEIRDQPAAHQRHRAAGSVHEAG
jgi:hypothetical protein